jgi:hypothetical protein
MKYRTVSGIEREIARLVPVLKTGKGGGYPKEGTQWPFLRKGKFDFEDGLARLRLVESEDYQTSEVLVG